MSNFGDHLILQLIKEGQVEGYRALFSRYYKPLCMQAFKLLKNEEDAEDIVQSTFVYLWNNQKFDEVQTSLASYLSTSVRFASLDYLKRTRREQWERDDYLHLNSSLNWDDDPEVLEAIFEKMEAEIEQLPSQCRLLFTLVYFEKKSYKEAAELTGVSLNTVKTQLRIAMGRLRTALRVSK